MEYEAISTTVQTILALCGAIALVGGAIAVVIKACKPFTSLEKRVKTLEDQVGDNETDLSQLKKMQSAQIQATVAMLDHMITGNHVDGMKKTRQDLINLLTECRQALKISEYTKPELDRFVEMCNFTKAELELFQYRSGDISLEACAENMHVSVSTIKRINQGIKSKMSRI